MPFDDRRQKLPGPPVYGKALMIAFLIVAGFVALVGLSLLPPNSAQDAGSQTETPQFG